MTPIDIEVSCVDPITKSSVKLYYRGGDSPAFNVVNMTAEGDDIYSGTIPADVVTATGVDYYIIASNSQVERLFWLVNGTATDR